MKRWLPGLILIVLVAFLAACTPQSAGSPTATPTPSPTPTASPGGSSEVHTVTIQEVKDKLDKGEKLVLIDVRSQSQFTAGHLQGARNIPEGELVARSLDFPLDSQVIVYASCL